MPKPKEPEFCTECIDEHDPAPKLVVAGGLCRNHYQKKYRSKDKKGILSGTEAAVNYAANHLKMLRKAHAKIMDGLVEAGATPEKVRQVEAIVHDLFEPIGPMLGWAAEQALAEPLEGNDADFEPVLVKDPIPEPSVTVEPVVIAPVPSPENLVDAFYPPKASWGAEKWRQVEGGVLMSDRELNAAIKKAKEPAKPKSIKAPKPNQGKRINPTT